MKFFVANIQLLQINSHYKNGWWRPYCGIAPFSVMPKPHKFHVGSCLRMRPLDHRDIILCASCRLPRSSESLCNDLHDTLRNLEIRYQNSPIFILDDFNFLNIGRVAVQMYTCRTFDIEAFINLCTVFNLYQIIYVPTWTTATCCNILDLVCATNPGLVSSIHYLDGLSDQPCDTLYLFPSIEAATLWS